LPQASAVVTGERSHPTDPALTRRQPPSQQGDAEDERPTVTLSLDSLAYEELARESARHGIPPSELASFAILYYLADVDSGRIARRITQTPRRQQGRGDGC
jgi:hypothetical protein